MPRGSKQSYTSKQRRQASHIEDSERKSGKSPERAKQIAYATVNKQDGGGKLSGSGRGKTRDTSSSSKGGRKRSTASRTTASRSTASTRTASKRTASTRTASTRGGSKAQHAKAGRASRG